MQFILNSEQETHDLASKIAKYCKSGDVILLKGGLGTGKSSFARGFIHSFYPSPIEVSSPTFNLIQTYNTHDGEIWHCDFYRIKDEIDAIELGIEDGFNNAITLIEWPEIIENILPENKLYIALEYGKEENSRHININPYGHFKHIDFLKGTS